MIEVDTQLMRQFKLMDYSLLFAIEKIPRSHRAKKKMSILSNVTSDNVDSMSNTNTSENTFQLSSN